MLPVDYQEYKDIYDVIIEAEKLLALEKNNNSQPKKMILASAILKRACESCIEYCSIEYQV
jgi:hypothetical protein